MAYKESEHSKPMKATTVSGGHMGGQGSGVTIKPSHFVNKPTGKTAHPAGKSNSKGAKKFNHG